MTTGRSLQVLPPIPVGELAQEPLSDADYAAIKTALASMRKGYPYLLLVKLLRNTGLRLAEVMRIGPEQIREEGPNTFVLIYRGKKARITWERVPLHPELASELREYIKGNGRLHGAPIWPFKARIFQRTFRTAAMEALGRRVTPHQLRHLYIKDLIDSGLPIEAAAAMVGHEDVRTTRRWYYDLTFDQRAEVNRHRAP